MIITDLLRAQHTMITAQLNYLDRLCRSDKKMNAEGLRQPALCMLHAVSAHADMEQELLKDLRKYFTNLDKTAEGVDVEHDQIARSSKALKSAKGIVQVRKIVRMFVRLLQDHMDKEESYVFKLAEAVLTPQQLRIGRKTEGRLFRILPREQQ